MDYSTKYLVRRLIRNYIFPHKKKFLLAILLMVFVAGTTSLYAYLVKPAVDYAFVEKDMNLLFYVSLAIFIVTIVKGVLSYFQLLVMSVINLEIMAYIRLELYQHFIYSDIAIYSRKSSGNFISNITNDVNLMMSAIKNLFTGLVRQLLTLLSLVVVMFIVNFDLALISFVGVPISAFPIYLVGRKLRKLSPKNQKALEKFTAQMDDTLKSVKLVKAYNAEEYELTRMEKILENIYKISRKITRFSLISSPFTETLTGIAIGVVIFYGGVQVHAGNTTPGDFFAFFAAMAMAYKPLKSISNMNSIFQLGIAGCKRVFEMLDEKPQIVDKPNAQDLENTKGDIEFKKVDFQYIKDKTALKDINLKIKAGSKVALVGHSGGGKSTIMSLILRFYDPQSGDIFVDGKNIKNLKIKSLRGSMAFVSQEVQLFDDTVLENIRYCKTEKTLDQVIEAAKMAEAHEFIEKLQNGYDTKIGQNGSKLSGGQRQRISIARAILHNPPILLLDEATSALDPVSERLVKNALDKLMEGRTTIVIAHRLSTVINADEIFVISGGKVVEQGAHMELLKKGKAYKELYQKQFEWDQ